MSANIKLLEKVIAYVKNFMSHYDGSHDFNHIERVLNLSHRIAATNIRPANLPPYNTNYITLAALLHDVGDRKYVKEGEDPSTMVQKVLLDLGASAELARAVQKITTHVSYSTEIKDPEAVLNVIKEYPELAVVQDADRLDAIGAIGIGRTFTFGGATDVRGGGGGGRGMGDTIEHFQEKLERIEGMMKTQVGKELAKLRTERLRIFRGWWEEETGNTPGQIMEAIGEIPLA